MVEKRAFICKNNQKSKENCFYIFLYSKNALSLHRFIGNKIINPYKRLIIYEEKIHPTGHPLREALFLQCYYYVS